MRGGRATLISVCAVMPACSLLFPVDVTGGQADDDASVAPDAAAGADGTPPLEAGDAPDAGRACVDRYAVPDLVAYYPLDERSGTTVHDCSGRGHDGQILRLSPSTWVDGRFGAAVRVAVPDGCIDFGTSPDFERAGPFTAMAWVNVGSFPTSGTIPILGKSASTFDKGWRLHTATVAELGAGVAIAGPDNLYVGRDGITPGTWRHVAVVFTPTVEFVLYLDGVRVSERTWPGPLLEDVSAPLRAGCRADNAGFLDGIVDEIRLYGRALTPAEIARLSAP